MSSSLKGLYTTTTHTLAFVIGMSLSYVSFDADINVEDDKKFPKNISYLFIPPSFILMKYRDRLHDGSITALVERGPMGKLCLLAEQTFSYYGMHSQRFISSDYKFLDTYSKCFSGKTCLLLPMEEASHLPMCVKKSKVIYGSF